MSFRSVLACGLLATAQLVAGHGAIIKATGDAGGTGMALGVVTTTPRDGTKRDPFQQDSTRFKANAGPLGETVGAGTNQLEAGTKAIMAETGGQLPQVTSGGSVTMTLHQVNADGGGPYTCQMNADGTGQTWSDIKVTTTPPGANSRNKAGAMQDFPLVAAMPAKAACTGNVAGQANVCLVRCMNAANAGPFGGVIPVQMAGTANATVARRNFINSIKRSEELLSKMMKRAATIAEEDEDEDEEE